MSGRAGGRRGFRAESVLKCRCGEMFQPEIRGDEIALACERCRRNGKLWSGKGTHETILSPGRRVVSGRTDASLPARISPRRTPVRGKMSPATRNELEAS